MDLDPTSASSERKLAAARSLTVLTGAGISADSGVPTFRGADGLWRNFRAEDLATPEAFERDPRLVWEWYNWRRELIATKQPNPAHKAVVELERRCPTVLADHAKCGWAAPGGRLTKNSPRFMATSGRFAARPAESIEDNHDVPIRILPLLPSLPGAASPAYRLVRRILVAEDLARCGTALQSCDVLLVIGTSGVVYPAAGFASVAKEAGAFVAEINLDPTPQSDWSMCRFKGRAKDLVPLLL